jgi:two-component system, sensor histidine kinase and response regulator
MGCRRWSAGDFALLLTDLHMPRMDGYTLAKAIRSEEAAGRRTPIIALTANALRDEELRCRAAGMDAYLSKPVQLAQLKASIEAWLGSERREIGVAEEPAAGVASAPADLGVLAALVGNDPTVITEVLHAFCLTAARSSAELSEGIRTGAWRVAADAAHKLKSAARSIGAVRLGDLCAQVEQGAEAGRSGELKALLPLFEAESIAVLRFLEPR